MMLRRSVRIATRSFMLATLALPAACSSPGSAPPAGASTATVFEHVRVITGDAAAPIEDATLVVADGRIVGLGSGSSVSSPSGARRVDLSGKTVMPAIIDTHTHLSQDREGLTNDLTRRA